MRQLLVTILLCTTFFGLQAQFRNMPSKVQKAYEEARMQMAMNKLESAESKVLKLIKNRPAFTEAYWLMAEIYQQRRDDDNRILWLSKACKEGAPHYTHSVFKLAWAELESGRYKEALENFLILEKKTPTSGELAAYIHNGIAQCRFAINAMEHPVPFKPTYLGDQLNTDYDDYWPSLTADENSMVTTVKVGRKPGFPDEDFVHEDFFISQKVDGEWSLHKNMGRPLNTSGNEGAQSLSSDGTLMFFSACSNFDSYGSCDIYYARKRNGQWSEPINCGEPVSTRFWDSHPSLSADGKHLYFVSERSLGVGGRDIWMADISEAKDGSLLFQHIRNLGNEINTSGNEISPFIHPDDMTLYFSSDGHLGMGRQDIFLSRRGVDGNWKKPANLGYPINTNQDEIGFVVGASGRYGYFSTEGLIDGKRDKDIFSLDLFKAIQPTLTTYLKGHIFDSKTGKAIAGSYEVTDVDADKVLMKSSADAKGNFVLCLPYGKRYSVTAQHEGYLFYSDHFDLKKDSVLTAYQKEIALEPVVVGSKIVLNNVFFAFGSDSLYGASYPELDKLVDFLKKNKTLLVEVSGHTDNVGSDEANNLLSQQRADAVCRYLISHEIPANQLLAKGYGEQMPVVSNDTEEGRAKNRRTELKILE